MPQQQDRFAKATPAEVDQTELNRLATGLIERCSTMVLATSTSEGPWAAPVYYVWLRGSFWFYSAGSSRHVSQGLGASKVAAAVWEDSASWRKIEGLQMEGRLSKAKDVTEATAIAMAYAARFPQAATILKDKLKGLDPCGSRIGLYAFSPATAIYTNNRYGLGFRSIVQLHRKQ